VYTSKTFPQSEADHDNIAAMKNALSRMYTPNTLTDLNPTDRPKDASPTYALGRGGVHAARCGLTQSRHSNVGRDRFWNR
jgi:hypothetical protein